MAGVKELVIPDERAAKVEKTRFGTAFNQGLALMLVSLVAVIVLTLFEDAQLIPQIYVKIVAAFFVLAGLARMFYPYVVGPGSAHADAEPLSHQSDTRTETRKLPPSLAVPVVETQVSDFVAASFDTSELVQPPSVTENTTKLLDRSRAASEPNKWKES